MKRALLLCLLAGPVFGMELGTNIPEANDADGSFMFADLMKHSRPWGTVAAPQDQACASIDANGWPTTNCGTYVRSGSALAPAGSYALSFDTTVGTTPSVGFTGGAGWSAGAVSCSGGHCTATVTATSSASQFAITFSGTTGGVQNVKLIMPGHTTNDTFNKAFLAKLGPYKVLRFMDTTNTNYSIIQNWSQRPTTASASQAGPLLGPTARLGMAWEYVCQLGNETGKDIWINVPAIATDSYVTSLATLIKNTCNPNVRVYVEYSNEVWNGQFTQFGQNYDRAQCDATNAWAPSTAYTTQANGGSPTAMYSKNGGNCYKATTGGTSAGSGGPTGTGSSITDGTVTWAYVSAVESTGDLSYDGATTYNLAYRRTARRAMEISSLFRAVFGNAAMMTRIRPVLMGQNESAPLQQGLPFIDARYGSPSNFFYCVGGAPYIQFPSNADGTLTVDRYFAEAQSALPGIASSVRAVSVYAKRYGLKVCNYEAGTHSNGSAANTNKVAAQTDARYPTLVKDYLKAQEQNGADLVVWYNFAGSWGTSGQWGAYETIYTPQVKSAALDAFPTYSARKPKYSRTATITSPDWEYNTNFKSGGHVVCNDAAGPSMSYKFTAPAGNYKVAITYTNTVASAPVAVYLNGTALYDAALPDNSGSVKTLTLPGDAGFPKFKAGDNVITLACKSSAQVHWVSLAVTDG